MACKKKRTVTIERTVAVGTYGWHQNHVISCVNLTVAVHLVTKNISDDKKARMDVITDTR